MEAGLAQLIYLVAFSYRFFLKGFTGLAVTLGCIVTLFIAMQMTGRIRVGASDSDLLLCGFRMQPDAKELRRLRICLSLFIAGLVVSSITAFPLQRELSALLLGLDNVGISHGSALMTWLHTVHEALVATNQGYPFLAYGTDWPAFGHLAIALAFLGLWIDPVRNKWLIRWGLITCSAVVPLAFAAGAIRSIPLYWRFIDSARTAQAGEENIDSIGLSTCHRLSILPLLRGYRKIGTDSRACTARSYSFRSLQNGASVSPQFFHSF